MTFEALEKIIDDNNIPHDVRLMSDSGWECSPTEMDGVYYCKDNNTIIFRIEGCARIYEEDAYECKGTYKFVGGVKGDLWKAYNEEKEN